jgi:hypothetical protein
LQFDSLLQFLFYFDEKKTTCPSVSSRLLIKLATAKIETPGAEWMDFREILSKNES